MTAHVNHPRTEDRGCTERSDSAYGWRCAIGAIAVFRDPAFFLLTESPSGISRVMTLAGMCVGMDEPLNVGLKRQDAVFIGIGIPCQTGLGRSIPTHDVADFARQPLQIGLIRWAMRSKQTRRC